MPVSMIREFLKFEAAGGIVLIIAAALALVLANSPLDSIYLTFLDTPLAIQVGGLVIAKPMLLWINDGLMAVFFFLVGLEIKREFLEGELASRSQIVLPATAAVGGMAVPALIYVVINLGHPEHLNGWAIPAATDIAFALGILALLGSRAPLSLKVLLTAIAIIDDLGAIVILAVFYTDDLSLVALGFGFIFILGLIAINGLRVTRLAPYVLLGIALWICVLKSGVHATLAGVITAFAIPLRTKGDEEHSLLRHVEHELHPWIAFAILPIFAFANAGVSFTGMDLSSLVEPVKLGVSLGLFVGKQIGVFGLLWLCVRLGWAPLPPDTNWVQLYGVALLCGVGFTMSLFIGSLAFEHTSFDAPIRLGVLIGSLVSGLCGYLLLQFGPVGAPKQTEAAVKPEPDPEPEPEPEPREER
jgi:NhaA family Na+:H+ antiporter